MAKSCSIDPQGYYARHRLAYLTRKVRAFYQSLEPLNTLESIDHFRKLLIGPQPPVKSPVNLQELYIDMLALNVAANLKHFLLDKSGCPADQPLRLELHNTSEAEAMTDSIIALQIALFELHSSPWGAAVYLNTWIDSRTESHKPQYEKSVNVLAWHFVEDEPKERLRFARETSASGLPAFLRPQHCYVCGELLPEDSKSFTCTDKAKGVENRYGAVCSVYARTVRDDIARLIKASQIFDKEPLVSDCVVFAAYRHLAHLIETTPYQHCYLRQDPSAPTDWYGMALLGFPLQDIPNFLQSRLEGRYISFYSQESDRVIRIDDMKNYIL